MAREKRINKAASVLVALGIVVAVMLFFFVPFVPRSGKAEPFTVRVRLMKDSRGFDVSVKGKCAVQDIGTEEALEETIAMPEGTKVLPEKAGIKIGKKLLVGAERVRLSPLQEECVGVNGKLYRGQIDLVKIAEGLDVINRVELEDYLKGVIPKEMHQFWPFAVIEAQSIASRSFAVYQALRRKSKEYDLAADTFSQVYGGRSAEKWRTSRAVQATRGKVLVYEGKVFPAYFHSTCGGHTQDALRLWGIDLEPLKGVRCPWCRWSPYYRWRKRLSAKTILNALKKRGYAHIRRIDDVREGARDASGRLEYVRIRSGKDWFDMSSEDFRSAVGKSVLKSSNFRIKKYPFFYLFNGHGWGHGVGMCQWGAFGLSLKGRNAAKILEYYYPGTKVEKLTEVLGTRD